MGEMIKNRVKLDKIESTEAKKPTSKKRGKDAYGVILREGL